MKTKLVVNDNLKPYLYEERERSNLFPEYEDVLKRLGKDTFNWQWRFIFDNKYGASVIKFFASSGFDEDLFELAVTYNNELTDEIYGYLSNDEVIEILYKIKDLKGEKENEN